VTAPKGTLLVEAAKLIGLEIPIFCYHPKLKPVGACRMCLVQIEKLPRLQTACTTPVAADMIVHTNTPDVIAAQNGVIELLLANHPLDCPICDKGGECPLQDNTFSYGLGTSRFTEEKQHKDKAYNLGPRIVLDRERCIMCYRCVRFHQEIAGDEALAAVQRGVDSEIATLTGEPYDSIFSGNTIELCPVGALTSRQYRFKARPWDLVRTPSVCNGCAVGCNVEVHSRSEMVLRLVSRDNPAVDDGWLCDRGRFDTLPLAEGRPRRPMLRTNGALTETSWQDALTRAREILGSSPRVLASPGLSNEAFFVMQQAETTAALWPPAGASWPVQGAIENLARCKSIVLVGVDVWNELPVLALWIRKAVTRGAALVSIGEHNGLWRNTTHWLRGDALALAEELGAAIGADVSAQTPPEIRAAAAAVRGNAPAAVLAHPSLVARGRRVLEALARALGANAETGLVGAPLLGANGRGAQDLAPVLSGVDATAILHSQAILAFGDEAWVTLESTAQLVVATSNAVPDDPRIEVVLPLAHPYERQASITNLQGRVQQQEGGAAAPSHARADWSVAGALFGGPTDLESIRSLLIEQHPALASVLQSERLGARV
jgi:NADH-quinone oxidoreductase subunit G